MAETPIVTEAQGIVQRTAAELTVPWPRECLACFLNRMLDDFGCDTTLRFARRFRDVTAPRATALEERLGRSGGYCDCEVLMNAVEPSIWLWRPPPHEAHDEREDCPAPEPPEWMPSCQGVRRGSTQPCANWQRRLRWRW